MEYGAIVPFSLNGSLAHGNEEGEKKKVYLNSYQQCQLVIGTFTNLNVPILTLRYRPELNLSLSSIVSTAVLPTSLETIRCNNSVTLTPDKSSPSNARMISS